MPLPKMLDPAELFRVAPTDLRETIALSGEVRPLRRVTLSAEVGGVAAEVSPQPGEQVLAGATLLTIRRGDLQLALQGEEAAMARLVAERRHAAMALERTARLAERGATAPAALEQAQGAVAMLNAQIAAAQSRIVQAKANLARAQVVAPYDAHIISRWVEPGQLVNPGDALFELADLSVVSVMALVPIAQAGSLRAGLRAEFWFAENPSVRIPARLVRIGAETAPGTRAVPVWFEIDNRTHALPGGSFLIGEVVSRQEAQGVAVPRTALRPEGGTANVLAIREGVAVLVPVEPGADWPGDMVAVKGGLAAGDIITRLPLLNLAPGDPVRVVGE
ncbi:efflux RND transporter periplasmic adaptor subunit [Fertoebacter nigrum]|uniref:Efflux RND transporter periplasmic adaptor subunit n=1 Tax=Fertoeibacter niger TaxID=2656921 RepID=A0A8X8GVB0_9RHOB|nr:efflux RND transporter periplasmic adaptor subunit [Fertoeibacter niger]NUB45003.1 efflux RND transporter periplasmic adaptor subunit [Fertoeibacter niger]